MHGVYVFSLSVLFLSVCLPPPVKCKDALRKQDCAEKALNVTPADQEERKRAREIVYLALLVTESWLVARKKPCQAAE